MSLPSRIETVIIGAGAAGLGAARTLQAANRECLILEARDRIGGRAHTITAGGLIFDRGCEWLHSGDINSFTRIALDMGIAVNRSRAPWREEVLHGAFPQELRRDYLASLDAFYARAEEAAWNDTDAAAATCLEPGNRWNPMIDAISTYINGTELAHVSLHDMDAYEDNEVNWRLPEGYGALIARYGAPCPVSLNTQVTLLDHASKLIRIETTRGTIEADHVIICVPTNLIANESIRFSPKLPDKVEAAGNLPLGLDNKVLLALDRADDLPADSGLRAPNPQVKIGSYHIRPLGQSCITGFFGGTFARELEAAGEGALAAQAIDEVVGLLGSSFRHRLTAKAETRWSADPFAQGAYSYARIGHAEARATLAEPVDGRLFFAGEATSPNYFSTAHGARDTGERAAMEVVGRK